MEEFDWGGLLGGLLQGGSSLYGYDELMGQVDDTRSDLFGEDGTGGRFAGIRGEVGDEGAFRSYGVRGGNTGMGTTDFGANGLMNYNLGSQQKNQMDRLRGYANTMYGQSMSMDPALAAQASGNFGAANDFRSRSMMDTGAREQDIYGRIREMQRPEETRQYEQMNAGLFGSGRGGMQTDAYGGTPEEMAFGKARAEAMNTASFQSMNQAQQEMMNYGNMANMYGQSGMGALGQGAQMQQMYGQMAGQMQQAQYLPMQQLMAMNQQGMQGGQMRNQSGQAMAGLLSQLGLGEATTQVNLDNVKGTAFAGLMEALGLAAGGVGQSVGDKISSSV